MKKIKTASKGIEKQVGMFITEKNLIVGGGTGSQKLFARVSFHIIYAEILRVGISTDRCTKKEFQKGLL
jgi:hypothetical protein